MEDAASCYFWTVSSDPLGDERARAREKRDVGVRRGRGRLKMGVEESEGLAWGGKGESAYRGR